MGLTPKERDLHRKLIEAFNDYIKFHLRWEERQYDSNGVRARKALRKIIDTAYLRYKEIQYVRNNQDREPEITNEFFRQVVKKHSNAPKADNYRKRQPEETGAKLETENSHTSENQISIIPPKP